MLAAGQQQQLLLRPRGGHQVRLAAPASQQLHAPPRLHHAAFAAAAAAASSRRPRRGPPAPRTAAAAAAPAPAGGGGGGGGGDDDDDVDWTEDMPATVRRRVRALRGVQERLDALSRRLARERAALEAKYEREAAPLLDERAAVVSGGAGVDAFDVPDDDDGDEDEGGGAPDAGIPDFWLTAMTNHDMVGEYVTERDAEVLACLSDVRAETLEGDEAGGFRLAFYFSWPAGTPPAFGNAAPLTKTFYMEDAGELVPKRFVGTDVEWAAGRDPTVAEVKRKKKKAGGKKGGGKGAAAGADDAAAAPAAPAFEPCDSFFRFFRTPEVPDDPSLLDPDALDALQEQMDEDYEIGCAFRDQLVPRAVEWFTGEASAAPFFGDEEEEEDGEGEGAGEGAFE